MKSCVSGESYCETVANMTKREPSFNVARRRTHTGNEAQQITALTELSYLSSTQGLNADAEEKAHRQ